MQYSRRFSWSGREYQKRPKENSQLVYRRKRNVKADFSFMENHAEVTKAGAFVTVQKISIIDEYLVGSPRSPFKFPRRLIMINILTAEEPNFDDLSKKLLEKLWTDYGIGNVAIITVCSNQPQVLS